MPQSWRILPIPRYADYGAADRFVTLGKAAIVRRKGTPYQTVCNDQGELAVDSSVTEEELSKILHDLGVHNVAHVSDDLASYEEYDTLILLGAPRHNKQTATAFREWKLTFDRWDDPRTPDDDFTEWSDFGREGYLLKVGRCDGRNLVVLAGYDYDDVKKSFHGAPVPSMRSNPSGSC